MFFQRVAMTIPLLETSDVHIKCFTATLWQAGLLLNHKRFLVFLVFSHPQRSAFEIQLLWVLQILSRRHFRANFRTFKRN
uniref:Uncharacterized protein n=1 Tax=Anopheles atroparvus TaxID=41427 RepID=A0AAG5CSX2_ANOAO